MRSITSTAVSSTERKLSRPARKFSASRRLYPQFTEAGAIRTIELFMSRVSDTPIVAAVGTEVAKAAAEGMRTPVAARLRAGLCSASVRGETTKMKRAALIRDRDKTTGKEISKTIGKEISKTTGKEISRTTGAETSRTTNLQLRGTIQGRDSSTSNRATIRIKGSRAMVEITTKDPRGTINSMVSSNNTIRAASRRITIPHSSNSSSSHHHRLITLTTT